MCVGVCHLPSSVRRPSASAAALPKIGKFRLTGLGWAGRCDAVARETCFQSRM